MSSDPSTPTELDTPEQAAGPWSSDEERLESLRRALDAIRDRARAEVGADDLEHIRNIDRLSRRLQRAGRVLIHASVEPFGFALGVASLAAGNQLQVLEIGHTALHGAYDRLPDAGRFHSKRFVWHGEIEEESWRRTHNQLHHGYTNILNSDPDIQVGFMRWTSHVPHRWYHRFQVPLATSYLTFWWTGLSTHASGVNEVYCRDEDECVILPDKSAQSIRASHRRALRKILPYKLVNYLLYPALAGPFFGKVLLGNWLADAARDVYSAATIYCNHIGADVHVFAPEERARNRAKWYEMQIRATNNFDVPHWASILCGGLDRHIEHHLFPRLPPNRLREISSEVKDVCQRHGVPYRSHSWPRALYRSFRHLSALRRPASPADSSYPSSE